MKIGLTLGKFAPLHKGHEFLIKEACKQLDGGILYVVLYDDIHYRNIPLQTRADWIRKNDAFLGYNIQVILGYDSPNDCGDSDEVKNIQENYLLNVLGLKDFGITHFFSSEEYGSHVAKALNAIDVRIDMERSNVNISGTMIRNDTYCDVYGNDVSKVGKTYTVNIEAPVWRLLSHKNSLEQEILSYESQVKVLLDKISKAKEVLEKQKYIEINVGEMYVFTEYDSGIVSGNVWVGIVVAFDSDSDEFVFVDSYFDIHEHVQANFKSIVHVNTMNEKKMADYVTKFYNEEYKV